MPINTGLLNALYLLEALQALPLLVIAGWVGYLIIGNKRVSKQVKLWLWSLFTFNVIIATTVWSLALYNYTHYERPLYRLDNLRYARQR